MLIITRAPAGKTSKRGGSKRDTEAGRASRSDAFFAFRAISINSVKIKIKIKKKEKKMEDKKNINTDIYIYIYEEGTFIRCTIHPIHARHFSNVSVPRA